MSLIALGRPLVVHHSRTVGADLAAWEYVSVKGLTGDPELLASLADVRVGFPHRCHREQSATLTVPSTRGCDAYAMLRRYTPELLETVNLRAAPAAADLLEAVDVLRQLNRTGSRAVPADAPKSIIRPRWGRVVLGQDGGIDRAFYEMCVLAELRYAQRSGDIWVEESRQYKDFDGYLRRSGTAHHPSRRDAPTRPDHRHPR